MVYFHLHKNREGEYSVIQNNDENKGYRAYHEKAKAAFNRHNLTVDCELLSLGYQKFENVLSAEKCAEYIKGTDSYLNNWTQKINKRKVIPIIEEIITDGVDKAIISHFKSEYVPTTIEFLRTEPGADTMSSRWHYDVGPDKHLIMMVYLTDSETDGTGTTIFVDRKTSKAFLEGGYAFGPMESRLNDKDARELANSFGEDFEPVNLHTIAGDAVIFDARHIMHRGCYPKKLPRNTITTAFIPYVNDWKTGCAATFFPRQTRLFATFPKVTW